MAVELRNRLEHGNDVLRRPFHLEIVRLIAPVHGHRLVGRRLLRRDLLPLVRQLRLGDDGLPAPGDADDEEE